MVKHALSSEKQTQKQSDEKTHFSHIKKKRLPSRKSISVSVHAILRILALTVGNQSHRRLYYVSDAGCLGQTVAGSDWNQTSDVCKDVKDDTCLFDPNCWSAEKCTVQEVYDFFVGIRRDVALTWRCHKYLNIQYKCFPIFRQLLWAAWTSGSAPDSTAQ